MKFFLIAFVFLLSLGQLQRIQITNNLAFYLHDLLIIGFLIWEFFAVFLRGKKINLKSKKINNFSKKLIYLFLASISISWIMAFFENRFDLKAILYFSRLVTYVIFVFLLQRKLNDKNWLWRLVSINLLILGFVQYFLLPDLRFLIYEGFDDHFFRMSSTILDPSFLGLIFVFNLNFYLWQRNKNWALILLFSLALLLTYSRAAYLALFISTLILLARDKTQIKKLLISYLAVFLICLPFLPKQSGGDGVNLFRQKSIEVRLTNDLEILNNIKGAQWLFGQGLFIPKANLKKNYETTPIHAHFADNLIVFLISNIGIIGSGLLALLVLRIFDPKDKEGLILLSSLLVHGMFNHNISQSFVLLIFLGFYFSQKEISSKGEIPLQ